NLIEIAIQCFCVFAEFRFPNCSLFAGRWLINFQRENRRARVRQQSSIGDKYRADESFNKATGVTQGSSILNPLGIDEYAAADEQSFALPEPKQRLALERRRRHIGDGKQMKSQPHRSAACGREN